MHSLSRQLKNTAVAGAVALGMIAGLAQAAETINGAGATFPYPIYAKWAEAYKAKTGMNMNYQSIGSGGGIKQITAKTVDFGASDAPLTVEKLSEIGLMQFPMVMGGVVPVVNLEGVKAGELKLTGAVLADIYLGKITSWDDAALKNLNPGVKLPNGKITVVSRADGSGTTFIFTNYLSKVNADWKAKVGEGTAVNWPTGAGGKGNEGVAAFVQRLPNSIGYVEYAYAKQNKMSFMQLQNRSGSFVKPDDVAFKAAAAGADWSRTFYQILTDQPGKDSWPITGATYILMFKAQEKPATASVTLKFFDWAYANGDAMADELDYVPLPASLKDMIHKQWADNLKDKSGKAIAFK
jgi:phosphate transport system substrate-binding protein